MANSSYYYKLYKQQKDTAKDCEKYITKLEGIKNSLISDFYDEQRNVNNELMELKEDLGKSVRHDLTFDRTKDICETNKEKAVNADYNLSRAITSLEEEIMELNRKKGEATAKQEEYYENYKGKKEEERQEFLDKINIFN